MTASRMPADGSPSHVLRRANSACLLTKFGVFAHQTRRIYPANTPNLLCHKPVIRTRTDCCRLPGTGWLLLFAGAQRPASRKKTTHKRPFFQRIFIFFITFHKKNTQFICNIKQIIYLCRRFLCATSAQTAENVLKSQLKLETH